LAGSSTRSSKALITSSVDAIIKFIGKLFTLETLANCFLQRGQTSGSFSEFCSVGELYLNNVHKSYREAYGKDFGLSKISVQIEHSNCFFKLLIVFLDDMLWQSYLVFCWFVVLHAKLYNNSSTQIVYKMHCIIPLYKKIISYYMDSLVHCFIDIDMLVLLFTFQIEA
jgi:hypothetical protein